MATDYTKPFRISLKIAPGKPIHIYIKQLQQIMADDTSLHPMMEKTLKLLKRTHTPYIMLATVREVVYDPINFRHFDRSAEPRGSWVCTLWSDEETKQYKENTTDYIKASLKLFAALGYELFDSNICSEEYIESLVTLCSKQIENQMEGRQ
jgi:hypothetical protein